MPGFESNEQKGNYHAHFRTKTECISATYERQVYDKRQGAFWANREVNSNIHLQENIGNQSQPHLYRAKPDNPEAIRVGHDFSQIPVYAKAPLKVQPKLTVNTPGDIYEREADYISRGASSIGVRFSLAFYRLFRERWGTFTTRGKVIGLRLAWV